MCHVHLIRLIALKRIYIKPLRLLVKIKDTKIELVMRSSGKKHDVIYLNLNATIVKKRRESIYFYPLFIYRYFSSTNFFRLPS